MKKLIYVFIVIIVIAIPLFLFYPVSKFPSPTGPYGVGQKSYHWVDANRKELNAKDPKNTNREIMTYVYYPTQKNKTSTLYNPKVIKNTINFFNKTTGLPMWLFSGLYFVKTNLEKNAEIAKTKPKFPVIIFSHGGGPMIEQYTWLLQDLASYGFVVVGINHTYLSSETLFPDGRIVSSISSKMKKKFKNRKLHAEWRDKNIDIYVQDIRFVINKIKELVSQDSEFWNAIDLEKIGVMGHSFGGSAAVRAYREENRIKCGINLEGSIRAKDAKEIFPKPFLFFSAEKSHVWSRKHHLHKTGYDEEKLNPKDIKATRYQNDDNMKIVTIKEVGHSIFLDVPLLLNTTLLTRILSHYYNFYLGVPSYKASKILVNEIAPYIVDFFEEHLNDNRSERKNLS